MKSEAKTRPYYTTRITATWDRGVPNILDTGDLLIEAKKNLKHGEFEAMIKAGLPFDPSVARRLMIIARDHRIRAHAHDLPPSWTTLYELTKLPDKAFLAALESRAIHPGMQRDDATLLVAQERRKARPRVVAPNGYTPSDDLWEATKTTVWDRAILKVASNMPWKELVSEGEVRALAATRKPNGPYSGAHSKFAGAVAEAIVLRGAELGKRERVLDTSAGGAIRGAVTEMMGHEYHGVDVWEALINENRAICADLGLAPQYHHGDGTVLDCVKGPFDFCFTCPPYWTREPYSGQDNCLAAKKTYAEFDAEMAKLPVALRPKMKPGAKVCMVVGNVRDKDGELIDLPGHTIRNFKAAGFRYLTRADLVDPIGAGYRLADYMWENGEKLYPRDQHILWFKTPEQD